MTKLERLAFSSFLLKHHFISLFPFSFSPSKLKEALITLRENIYINGGKWLVIDRDTTIKNFKLNGGR